MDRFRGRVAVVTGASAGIGEAIARQLCVDHGMKVVGVARRVGRLLKMEKEFFEMAKAAGTCGQFFAAECDLDLDEDIWRTFDWIRNHPDLGQVDVCICNAGISTGEPLSEAPPDLWRRLFNVNVVSASLCAQISVNMMIEKGITDGQVIFINSLCGHKTYPDRNVVFYNASKLALTCVVDGWRREVQELGNNKIRVSQVSPGLVETEIIYATKPHQVELSKQVFAANPHLKPDQVAHAVVALMSVHPDVHIRDIIIDHVHEKL